MASQPSSILILLLAVNGIIFALLGVAWAADLIGGRVFVLIAGVIFVLDLTFVYSARARRRKGAYTENTSTPRGPST